MKGFKMGRDSKASHRFIEEFRHWNIDDVATVQRIQKREKAASQRSFQNRELKNIITENIKYQIEAKQKQGYSMEDIVHSLANSESKLYAEILVAVIKRTKMTVSLRDARALKTNDGVNEPQLINPKGDSLDAKITRFFNDKILIMKLKIAEKCSEEAKPMISNKKNGFEDR